MKTLVLLFTLGWSVTIAAALFRPESGNSIQSRSLVAQLASYVTYPEQFQRNYPGGVLVVSFRVDAEQRLRQVVVHGGNAALKMQLIRELTGKAVRDTQLDSRELHYIRLRFEKHGSYATR